MTNQKRQSIDDLLRAKDQGWVRVLTMAWRASALEVVIAIDERRSGRMRECWKVTCKKVREYKITDVNGGGLALYDQSHPLVRQHSDEVATLRFSGRAAQPAAVLGRLLCAHGQVSDDWISFDTYSGEPEALLRSLENGSGKLATGPRFLLEAYAQVLRESGLRPNLRTSREGRRGKLVALHFGNSCLVAGSIQAERLSTLESG
jgi:hypothetical protein